MTFRVSVDGALATLTAPLDRIEHGGATQAGCLAINHTVAKAATQVKRALVHQTGLRYGELSKEIRQFSASAGDATASLQADGPYHRLSEFGARETAAGVSAAPWDTRRLFEHTFVIEAYAGGVFKRQGDDRFPVEQLWGPATPKEMLKDASLEAWERVLIADLPVRMAHEWGRLFGG